MRAELPTLILGFVLVVCLLLFGFGFFGVQW